jgi:hypothetical protein
MKKHLFNILILVSLFIPYLLTGCSAKPDKYQAETIPKAQQYMNDYNAEIAKTPDLKGCKMSIITPVNYKSVYIIRCPSSETSMTMMNSTVQNTITIDGTTYVKQN